MKTIFISLFLWGSFSCFAENLKEHKAELIEPKQAQRKLATLDKGRHSVKNTKKIIELLRFHTNDLYLNGDDISLERDIPALGYILRSYDSDITPILLDYAVSVNDVLLRRRAVYCIENLSGKSIEEYMIERFGKGLKSMKFTELVEASLSDTNKRLKVLNRNLKENYEEVGTIEFKKLTFYFPSMPANVYELKIPE